MGWPFHAILAAQTFETGYARTPICVGRFHAKSKTGRLRLYEAGHTYSLPRAVAHAATKRGLVAKQRPPHWTSPSIFRPPEALSEAEVIEAEAELKALQRHALELVDPEV